MIYNLVQYIRNNLNLGVSIIANSYDPSDPESNVCVRESPGDPSKMSMMIAHRSVQVITRGKDDFHSHQMAEKIYNLLRERYDIVLPAPIPGEFSQELALVKPLPILSISAIQTPYPFGSVDGGQYEYSCNYLLTFQELRS